MKAFPWSGRVVLDHVNGLFLLNIGRGLRTLHRYRKHIGAQVGHFEGRPLSVSKGHQWHGHYECWVFDTSVQHVHMPMEDVTKQQVSQIDKR